MNLTRNAVLITWKNSELELELELAKRLLNKNNAVIICGRPREKLLEAEPHLTIREHSESKKPIFALIWRKYAT